MSGPKVHSYEDRVKRMFDAYDQLPESDEIRSHWAKYLCMQVASLLEVSIRSMLSDFSKSKSEPRVGNYVDARLNYFTNAKCERIEALLGEFSKDWSQRFNRELSDEEKDAINSIIGNRHQIAHGRDVEITFVRIKGYYDDASQVIQRIRTMVTE